MKARVGGGYPPKCPQNGSRYHGVLEMGDLPDADFWPGDTYTMAWTGVTWRLNSDGTWTSLGRAAAHRVYLP